MAERNSDGSMVNKDWKSLTATTSGTPSAVTAMSATTIYAERCLIKALATNTQAVWFGADASASFRGLTAGQEYELSAQTDRTFNLASLKIKSSAASQGLTVLYQ